MTLHAVVCYQIVLHSIDMYTLFHIVLQSLREHSLHFWSVPTSPDVFCFVICSCKPIEAAFSNQNKCDTDPLTQQGNLRIRLKMHCNTEKTNKFNDLYIAINFTVHDLFQVTLYFI